MCTVSVLPGAWLARESDREPLLARLVVSRDERRERPRARPPETIGVDGRVAVVPVDPQGGGTWVALTDAGLALALLNVNESRLGRDPQRASRGGIIPQVAGASDLDDCLARAARLDPSAFNSCRLIVCDGKRIGEVVIRRDRLQVHTLSLDDPFVRISSSLGDHRVRRRLDLFRRFFFVGPVSPRRQDDFHRHRWPRRGPASVRMRRRDAETVSITTVELFAEHATLGYREVVNGSIGPELHFALPMAQ